VANSDEIRSLVAQTVEHYGRLDFAFNNDGIEGKFAPITELSETDWEQTMAANLKAVWLCMKYEITQMLKQESGGTIVNTSSWLAKGGLAGSTIYSASKGGLDSMIRSAALEYAMHNIRINNINPGIIDTEMLRRFFHPDDDAAKPLIDHIPVQRLGTSEELAETVVWLCSDASSYITGQSISVDGGYAIPGHRVRDLLINNLPCRGIAMLRPYRQRLLWNVDLYGNPLSRTWRSKVDKTARCIDGFGMCGCDRG
jgi:NAD(P)-dependent dehydrogenase (short-subunit alcohol dehydrogenase family)